VDEAIGLTALAATAAVEFRHLVHDSEAQAVRPLSCASRTPQSAHLRNIFGELLVLAAIGRKGRGRKLAAHLATEENRS
jgi:hypothetical protein